MKKILIVSANYYIDISTSMEKNTKFFLNKNKLKYALLNVPGVFEIPVVIAKNINLS